MKLKNDKKQTITGKMRVTKNKWLRDGGLVEVFDQSRNEIYGPNSKTLYLGNQILIRNMGKDQIFISCLLDFLPVVCDSYVADAYW